MMGMMGRTALCGETTSVSFNCHIWWESKKQKALVGVRLSLSDTFFSLGPGGKNITPRTVILAIKKSS